MYKITFIYRMKNGHKTALTQASMLEKGETDLEAVCRLREELEMEGFVLVAVLEVERSIKMVAVYEFDFAGLRWTRVSVFKYEADADFYIAMRRRYVKNIMIRKEVMYNA